MGGVLQEPREERPAGLAAPRPPQPLSRRLFCTRRCPEAPFPRRWWVGTACPQQALTHVLGFAGQRPPWTPCEYRSLCPGQPCPPHLEPTWRPGPKPGLGVGLLRAETWPPPRSAPLQRGQTGPAWGPGAGSEPPGLLEPLGCRPHLSSLPQGEAGVSGLPGGLGLRGPPVSGCPRTAHRWERAPSPPTRVQGQELPEPSPLPPAFLAGFDGSRG